MNPTVSANEELTVAAGERGADAPVDVAGTLNVRGELAVTATTGAFSVTSSLSGDIVNLLGGTFDLGFNSSGKTTTSRASEFTASTVMSGVYLDPGVVIADGLRAIRAPFNVPGELNIRGELTTSLVAGTFNQSVTKFGVREGRLGGDNEVAASFSAKPSTPSSAPLVATFRTSGTVNVPTPGGSIEPLVDAGNIVTVVSGSRTTVAPVNIRGEMNLEGRVDTVNAVGAFAMTPLAFGSVISSAGGAFGISLTFAVASQTLVGSLGVQSSFAGEANLGTAVGTVAAGQTIDVPANLQGRADPLNVSGEYNVRGVHNITNTPGTIDIEQPTLGTDKQFFGGSFSSITTYSAKPTVAAGALGSHQSLSSAPVIGGTFTARSIESTFTGKPTVGFGGSTTVPSNSLGRTTPLNIAGEFNIRGTHNLVVSTGTIDIEQPTLGADKEFFGGSFSSSTAWSAKPSTAKAEFTPTTGTGASIITGGRFGPELPPPLTIPTSQASTVARTEFEQSAPVNVAGTLGVAGQVDIFSQRQSIAFDAALSTEVGSQDLQFQETFGGVRDNFEFNIGGVQIGAIQFGGGIEIPSTLLTFDAELTVTVPFAESTVAPVVWRVKADGALIDGLYDVDVIDTVNPFGNYAIAYFDDEGGALFDVFQRGTPVTIEVSDNDGVTFAERFVGYCVEAREGDDGGADALEVLIHSFDQFLRRNNVSGDLTGKTISQAIADIVQVDTPVTYVAGNVEVVDDTELTRSFRGEPVENVLRTLSFKSTNESFGVNNRGEFFFRPGEFEVNERGIDDTHWFDYDIPREGADAINEVEVFYDNNDKSVVVDITEDQLDLKDSLGLPKPGTQRVEIARPAIVDIKDAEDEGRRLLQFRNETLTGTVTTFGLFDLTPGDTIDIDITDRGIDDEFRVAEVRYNWIRDETELTIVEKRGDLDDILFDLSDTVGRLETADADRGGITDKLLQTESGIIIDTSLTDGTTTWTEGIVTNSGRNRLRDAFISDNYPSITTVKFGDSDRALSRTQTDIDGAELATAQVAAGGVDVSVDNTVTFTFEDPAVAGTAKEVALFTDADTCIARYVAGDESDIDITALDVTLQVANDPDVKRGVFTADGLTMWRNIIADNDPVDRLAYAFGSDDADVTAADTALNAKETEFVIGAISFANATGATELEQVGPDLTGDVTLDYKDGGLTRNRTAGWLEVPQTGASQETGDVVIDDFDTVSGNHSGGQASETDDMFGSVPSLIWQMDLPYDAERWIITVFGDIFGPVNEAEGGLVSVPDGEGGFETIFVPGPEKFIGQIETLGFSFQVIDEQDRETENKFNTNITGMNYGFNEGGDFGAVSSVIRGIQIDEGSQAFMDNDDDREVSQGTIRVDGIYFRDLEYNAGNVGTFDPVTQTYPGPGFYGGTNVVTFPTFTSPRVTDEVTVQSTWNNVSGGQYLEMTDGNGETLRANNTANHTFEFANTSDEFTLSIFLDEYADDPTTTPSQAGATQKITSLSVFAGLVPFNPVDTGVIGTRALLDANIINGTTIAEGGIKTDTSETLLSHVRYAEFDVKSNQRLVGNELISIRNGSIA